jgi:hypothetical protein
MADYQSLLKRAVANLPNTSGTSARQAIYDRARAALVKQLRSLSPPLPDSDIEREERALDKAIAEVELQFGPAGEPSPGAASDAGLKSAAPAAAPVSSAAPAEPPRPAPVGPPSNATVVRPIPPPQAAPVAQNPARPVSRPPAPSTSRPAAPGAGKPPAAPAITPGAAKPPPVQVAPGAEHRANAAPPVNVARTDGDRTAPTNLAAVVPNAQTDPLEGKAAPPVTASVADEVDPAPVSAVELERIGAAEGQRPSAPTTVSNKRRSTWPWLMVAVALGVALSIAVAAVLMRQKPQDLVVAPPPEQQQEAAQSSSKIAQRVGPAPDASSAPSPPPVTVRQQPTQPTAQEGQAPPPEVQQAPGQLPAAGRAAMLIASPDNPQKPMVNLGSTVWSAIPAAPDQPATVAVKAEADIPDLKMHATMILRKNTDPSLEATHTIDLKFAFADGAPIVGFKDVGLPQMRMLDSTAAEALSSVKVKISDVYFLIALAKGEQDLARNLDLIKTHAWFDFPLLLNDDRIAKLVFQKSADGDAILQGALEAWK